METLKFRSGQTIAQKNDIVKDWYLIQEGTVIQQFGFSKIKLSKNGIIGMQEKDSYLCDYIVEEDAVVVAFTPGSSANWKALLKDNDSLRTIFLRSAIEQRHKLLCLYADLNNNTRQFQRFVESLYNEYKNFTIKYRLEMRSLSRISRFEPPRLKHRAEQWEVDNSVSIVKNHLQEYIHLMEQDDSLTIGVIKEAAAQMHRFALGIGEMETYLTHNKDILLSDSREDIFGLFFDLAIQMFNKKHDITAVKNDILLIASVADKLNIYNRRMVLRRVNEFREYDFHGNRSVQAMDENSPVKKEMDIRKTDCMAHILEYAGYNDEEVDELVAMMEAYRDTPEKTSSDKELHALRRNITNAFYEIYRRVFFHSVEDESTLTPVLEMFLNFGFMDVSLVGEENAMALYDMVSHLDIFHSKHIFTIYEWLKCIYRGEKEPSKNEFDMDYRSHLLDQKKRGIITQEQLDEYTGDKKRMVEFEINNMFVSVNKQTYGKISIFCALLSEHDIVGSVRKMRITAEQIEAAVNAIRKIDYSVFYRDVIFSDVEKGINSEKIKKEILPDIILMPNAGSRGIMWQEASGIRNEAEARFMFPIFTVADVNETMLSVVGAYRWEMCRREQGVHWNDIRDKSLTAEYCAYIQFYKKNNELSTEAKEKIKTALARAKNSYKEVFARDYANWINFESKGSFRLNKITRDILVRYCPFVKEIREELKVNPVYQNSIIKFETLTARTMKRYQALYDKYVKAEGTKVQELKDNLLFYRM